jgi:hypothetical protein
MSNLINLYHFNYKFDKFDQGPSLLKWYAYFDWFNWLIYDLFLIIGHCDIYSKMTNIEHL